MKIISLVADLGSSSVAKARVQVPDMSNPYEKNEWERGNEHLRPVIQSITFMEASAADDGAYWPASSVAVKFDELKAFVALLQASLDKWVREDPTPPWPAPRRYPAVSAQIDAND